MGLLFALISLFLVLKPQIIFIQRHLIAVPEKVVKNCLILKRVKITSEVEQVRVYGLLGGFGFKFKRLALEVLRECLIEVTGQIEVYRMHRLVVVRVLVILEVLVLIDTGDAPPVGEKVGPVLFELVLHLVKFNTQRGARVPLKRLQLRVQNHVLRSHLVRVLQLGFLFVRIV